MKNGSLTYLVSGPKMRKAGAERNTKVLSVREAKGMFPAHSGEIDQALRAAKSSN